MSVIGCRMFSVLFKLLWFANFVRSFIFLIAEFSAFFNFSIIHIVLPPLQKKKPVDFDGELKIGDVRYDNIT